MGRFHRHDDGTVHEHDHPHDHAEGHEPPHDDGRSSGHGDHSGYGTGAARIEVLEAIFGENDRLAAANRADFDAAGVRVVNLMSSPGAGKTMLLRETLRRLSPRLRIGIGAVPENGDAADYVLSKFTKEEAAEIENAVHRAAEAVACWVIEGIEECMNRYN